MRKKLDGTVQMVMDIYKKPVPLQSEIANPFSANKRQRKKNIVINSNHELPENVNDWNTKHFVDYYASQYYDFFKATYKKTYASDCTVISEIFTFFEQNSQDKQIKTKEYIEWAFINNNLLTKNSGVFLITSLRNFLNYFMQDKVLSYKETNRAIQIYDDVHVLSLKGKTREIFAKFGIPIAATYFTKHKSINEKDMLAGINLLIETLLKGDVEQKNMLVEIVNKSIDRSPYPESFNLTNWREQFPILAENFNKESWWKDKDYSGKPNFDVERF